MSIPSEDAEVLMISMILSRVGAMSPREVRLARSFVSSLGPSREKALRALAVEGKNISAIAKEQGVSLERCRQRVNSIFRDFSKALLVASFAYRDPEPGEKTAVLMARISEVVKLLVAAKRPSNTIVHLGRDGVEIGIPLGELRSAVREFGLLND